MAAVTLLSTRGLSCHFGGVKAVDEVDFDMARGEIRAIIGPNGAGKSTFVNLVCGRVRPTAGRILFAGADVSHLPVHARVARGIAYTFQVTSIFSSLAVFDNVALAVQNSLHRRGRGAAARPDEELRRRVEQALDRVGLLDRRRQRAGALSYGHQRLLEVAMGIALEPLLLILDEPTQGLSDSEIAGFMNLVRSIARHATVLLIEHNMAVVMGLAHSITVFNNGRVLAQGSPAEIRANLQVQQAYLGT
ncbi:MAG: ABC transporter ATP-binding protein [Pseudomonadota bacterium]|nr:ABC transporter ATP-binding protein [Pseudomonadota bacterium]